MTREIVTFSGSQLAAGSEAYSTTYLTSTMYTNVVGYDFRVRINYSTTASTAAVVNFYSATSDSPAVWDTEPFYTFTMPLLASGTVQKTYRLNSTSMVGYQLRVGLENPGVTDMCGAGGFVVGISTAPLLNVKNYMK